MDPSLASSWWESFLGFVGRGAGHRVRPWQCLVFLSLLVQAVQGAGIWRERQVMPDEMVRLSDTSRGDTAADTASGNTMITSLA